MADVSTINGYSIKDEEARNSADTLSTIATVYALRNMKAYASASALPTAVDLDNGVVITTGTYAWCISEGQWYQATVNSSTGAITWAAYTGKLPNYASAFVEKNYFNYNDVSTLTELKQAIANDLSSHDYDSVTVFVYGLDSSFSTNSSTLFPQVNLAAGGQIVLFYHDGSTSPLIGTYFGTDGTQYTIYCTSTSATMSIYAREVVTKSSLAMWSGSTYALSSATPADLRTYMSSSIRAVVLDIYAGSSYTVTLPNLTYATMADKALARPFTFQCTNADDGHGGLVTVRLAFSPRFMLYAEWTHETGIKEVWEFILADAPQISVDHVFRYWQETLSTGARSNYEQVTDTDTSVTLGTFHSFSLLLNSMTIYV